MKRMNRKEALEKVVLGWLPKESSLAYASKRSKRRWRKPAWIAFTMVALIAIAFAMYTGVRTFIRYSNPQADVTASFFEKTLNCTKASVGNIVEVKVLIGWHGHLLPEFKRQVKIIDPFPESNFKLVGGNNTYEYSGFGGGDQFEYLLEVTSSNAGSIELPKPKLYLDNTEISLKGSSPILKNISA